MITNHVDTETDFGSVLMCDKIHFLHSIPTDSSKSKKTGRLSLMK